MAATPGVHRRHRNGCATTTGGRCNCDGGWQAWAYDRRSDRKLKKTLPTQAAAKAWRAETQTALRRGLRSASRQPMLRAVAEQWLRDADAGVVRNRGGAVYKPSALRGYENGLRLHVLPVIGGCRLDELTRADVQRLVDGLVRTGLSPSTVRNAVNPLRAICGRAVRMGLIAVNPTSDLELPAPQEHSVRIASPAEARELLLALPPADRALWATALYAGLRRGELRALRVDDVDLGRGVIRVERNWDDVVGPVDPKTRKGRRIVPILALLRPHRERQLEIRDARTRLLFASPRGGPFVCPTVTRHAHAAWSKAGVEPIGLHECRHTFVSICHAAGLSLEQIGDYVGHGSAYMTERYRHLIQGHELEAAARVDAYLAAHARLALRVA